MRRLGARRVLVISDRGVVQAGITGKVREIIEAVGIECEVFERVHIEPTLESLQEAMDFATDGGFDGFVGIGGGSSLEPANLRDLLAPHPAPLIEYFSPPLGSGRSPPSPPHSLLPVPTPSESGPPGTDS